jgi:molybdate transport system substrate-binding protein
VRRAAATIDPKGGTLKRLLSAFVLVAFALGISSTVRAQSEINLLAPGPIKEPLDKLLAAFQTKTGTHVKVTYAGGVPSRKQVAEGKGLDVDLLFAPFGDVLKTGNIVPGSATVVARVRLALAVKKGAPKPDISTPAAAKKTLLDAKSIASVDPAQGSVGGIAQAALDKLGIAEQVKPKLKWVPTGNVVQDLVAKGEIEIALGPYLSDMNNPGVDVAGPLPPGASTPVDITGFLSNSLKDTKSAKALLAYLRSSEAGPIWKEAKVFPVK